MICVTFLLWIHAIYSIFLEGFVCSVGLECLKCFVDQSIYLKFEYVSFPIGMCVLAISSGVEVYCSSRCD